MFSTEFFHKSSEQFRQQRLQPIMDTIKSQVGKRHKIRELKLQPAPEYYDITATLFFLFDCPCGRTQAIKMMLGEIPQEPKELACWVVHVTKIISDDLDEHVTGEEQ